MSTHLAVTGVIPPLVTPLTANRDLDTTSLERLADNLIVAGVSGLFVGGSTGEVALLTDDQRVEAVHVAVKAAAGRVPVFAGAIDTGTNRVIDHARRAIKAGAAAVVATPPFYVSPHPSEIRTHYRQIAAAVDAPVIAYDIPSAVHVAIPLEVIAELAADGTIAALKDSSGDMAKFRSALELVRDTGIGMLTGSEIFADLALQAGGTGIVPGLGNVDPDGYVAIQRLADAHDWAGAAAEQQRLIRLFQLVFIPDTTRIGFTAGALGAFKAALHLRGIIDSPTTAEPFAPLIANEIEAIRTLLTEAGLSVVR